MSTQRSRAALTHRAWCWVLQMEQSRVTDCTLQPLAGFQLFMPLESSGTPGKHRQQPAQHPQCTQRIRLSAPNTQHRAESRGETGKLRPWQVGQPWLEGGVLIGSHRYKICADKDVLPSWGMCHPPGGCATHLGDTSPILGTYHPPEAHITHLRGRIIHLGDILPT